MIDPQKFGEELAAIVKAATAPLIARIDQLQEEAERNAARVADLEKALQSVEPGPQGDPGPPGKDGEKGADGVGLAGALINSAGHLVLTLTNGETKDLGPVVGKDGKDGKDGEKGKDGERGADGVGLAGAMIDRDGRLVLTLSNGEAKELGPVVGKDGERGKDGKDGLGFEDLSFVEDEAGRPVAKFQRGDVVKSVTLPCIIDRGIFKAEGEYRRGDAVTFGGCLWIAQKDAPEGKPGDGEGWRLAVKKGRDGRDTEAKKVL